MPLIVIGHPIGMAQHISRKECRAAARNLLANNRLRHTCDTLRGNSGSPVIGEDGRKVVALHHAGDSIISVNFAVPIAAIAERSPIVAALTEAAEPVTARPPRGSESPPRRCRGWNGDGRRR
ncbi:serine protease [Mameliella sp. MMSF_3510]|uniref:trypsin-like serine peptidase n=1 Tax=Mameliella sp. MMSF_3510 TaxID=3046718 RepID=UPI003531FAD6